MLNKGNSDIKSQLSLSKSDSKSQLLTDNPDIRLNSPFENSSYEFERPTLSLKATPFVPKQYTKK